MVLPPILLPLATLLLGLGLLAAFVACWLWLTPRNYWDEIRNGNAAAALSLMGSAGGFVLPLALSAGAPLRLLFAAGLSVLAQAVFFAALRACYRGAWMAIVRADMAAATVIATGSLLAGLLTVAGLPG